MDRLLTTAVQLFLGGAVIYAIRNVWKSRPGKMD
jgi:hypothetical protein